MSPQEAISIMEPLEERFQVLTWRARCSRARLTDSNDTRRFEVIEPYNSRSEVVFDPIGERYCFRMSGTTEWDGGAAPFVSTLDQCSFDGETYRELRWSKPGTTLPNPESSIGLAVVSRSKGHLSVVPGKDLLEIMCFELGLTYMPPYFLAVGTHYPVQPLSKLMRTWLDEGKGVAVTENETGEWTIDVKLDIGRCWGAPDGSNPHLFRIAYDPRKGGAVGGVRALAPDKNGNYECENVRVEIDLQEVGGEFWAPKTIKLVWRWDKLMTITTCEAVEINPPVSAGAFRVDFPKGVYVTDYVKKMYYVTGDVVNQEAATRAFLQRTNTQ